MSFENCGCPRHCPPVTVKYICKARYEAFSTAGNASKIRVIDLEEMTRRYDKGDFDPRVN